MFRNRKLYLWFVMVIAIGFVTGLSATDSFAQKDSKKKRIKLSLAKKSDTRSSKDRYTVFQPNDKVYGKAEKVKDPVTGDPVEGRCTLEYVCLLDTLRVTQTTSVMLTLGESNRWEFMCDPLDLLAVAQSAPGLPITLQCP